MALFTITMKHSEETLERLSRMQYDLFCGSNRAARFFLSAAAVLFGVSNYSKWWGILLIAYGCFLMTSMYSSSNRTAHKLTEQIQASGLGFPCSEYVFEKEALRVVSLPEREEHCEPLPYSRVLGLGEDAQYYYIFRDRYGGYMIPKEALGDRYTEFRDFIEKKTGQVFLRSRSPLRRLLAKTRRRSNEPYHL